MSTRIEQNLCEVSATPRLSWCLWDKGITRWCSWEAQTTPFHAGTIQVLHKKHQRVVQLAKTTKQSQDFYHGLSAGGTESKIK